MQTVVQTVVFQLFTHYVTHKTISCSRSCGFLSYWFPKEKKKSHHFPKTAAQKLKGFLCVALVRDISAVGCTLSQRLEPPNSLFDCAVVLPCRDSVKVQSQLFVFHPVSRLKNLDGTLRSHGWKKWLCDILFFIFLNQIWLQFIVRAFAFYYSSSENFKCGLPDRWKEAKQLDRIIWSRLWGHLGRAVWRRSLWSFQRQEKTEGLCQEKHWGMSKFTSGQMQCWGISHDLEHVSSLFVFPVRKICVSRSRERRILSLVRHQ